MLARDVLCSGVDQRMGMRRSARRSLGSGTRRALTSLTALSLTSPEGSAAGRRPGRLVELVHRLRSSTALSADSAGWALPWSQQQSTASAEPRCSHHAVAAAVRVIKKHSPTSAKAIMTRVDAAERSFQSRVHNSTHVERGSV